MTDAVVALLTAIAAIGDLGFRAAVVTSLLVALTVLGWCVITGLASVCDWRRSRAEARLNRREAQLRRTILTLADAIADERLHAGQTDVELIRAAYLARGEVPERP